MPSLVPFIFRQTNLTPAQDCLPDKLSVLLDDIAEFMQIVDTSGGEINTGSLQPSPEDVGKPWIREDTLGAPLGLWQSFNGVYHPLGFVVGMQMDIHATDPEIAELRPGWFLADGLNQTEDRSGEFTGSRKIIEYRGF